MITVKAIFADGDSITTRINATEQEARAYYVGKKFNTGSVSDNMQTCVDLEVLE
jgi:hypothetical protein